ncbi:MAG: hypothetical protein K6B52_05255 [Clostridiales bacterium]|nr:hypothetical protein [Clostridiales bacterium]
MILEKLIEFLSGYLELDEDDIDEDMTLAALAGGDEFDEAVDAVEAHFRITFPQVIGDDLTLSDIADIIAGLTD